MAEPWTDDRIDAALVTLADELDIPRADDVAIGRPRHGGRTAWLVAAIVVAVVAGVVAVAPAREAVARWFGLRIEHDDGATATGSFADDVAVVDLDVALAATGLDRATVEASALGLPTAAGTPPEGGVVLSWSGGATTLWVRPGDDDVVVVKQLIGSSRAELVSDLGDYAVLLADDHVLDTPSRRVAAGTVLWWLADGRQWRLESDLGPDAMLAVARSLVPS